jgi:hypothetical protein
LIAAARALRYLKISGDPSLRPRWLGQAFDMAPPCLSFPASELPARIHEDSTGRRRKLEGGARQIDLAKCELLKIVQYECEVKEPIRMWSSINCYPIERLFRRYVKSVPLFHRSCLRVIFFCTVREELRLIMTMILMCDEIRCRDKSGPFMVESTAWESQQQTGGDKRHD